MTEQELKKALEQENIEHKNKVFQLKKSYALEKNTVKIGDIISSDGLSIQVAEIKICVDVFPPKCRYYGYELTKKGERRKDMNIESIYQDALKP